MLIKDVEIIKRIDTNVTANMMITTDEVASTIHSERMKQDYPIKVECINFACQNSKRNGFVVVIHCFDAKSLSIEEIALLENAVEMFHEEIKELLMKTSK